MFHPPSSLPTSTASFLGLTEVLKILADINAILSNTQFSIKVSNPCFILPLLLGTVILPIAGWAAFGGLDTRSLSEMVRDSELRDLRDQYRDEADLERERDREEGSSLPVSSSTLFFLTLCLPIVPLMVGWGCRMSRKSQLEEYVGKRSRLGDGIIFRFGGNNITGGGNGGGTYANFNMALYDQKGLLVSGFLNVFVDPVARETWCSRSGTPYVPPVPLGQEPYQPPPGYTLVPSQPHQPPPGFQLVPITSQQQV